MPTIYDPISRWLGTAPFQLVAGNKRPVTVDDSLTVPQDSSGVTIDVLANDYDPEGGVLTLVSANAALGTAVVEANNLVTYTPPPGLSGFDTVVYEVSDDVGQLRAGQVNVTIAEAALTVETQPDNTLVVTSGTGPLEITVSTPAAFAGTYQVDPNDLASGPVNLVIPTFGGMLTEGSDLIAGSGLWIHETDAGVPSQSWQWLRNGFDIAGATGASYTMTSADLQQTMSVRETRSDGNGQRSAVSAGIGNAFDPITDPQLLGWWDASDAATITETTGQVSSWADKAGGGALVQANGPFQPSTGTRSLNGLNVIDFDGTRYMERIVALPASGDVAFHMVLAIDSVASAFAAILAIEAGNDFQIDANHGSQFDGRLNASGIGTSVTLSGGPFGGAFILSAIFERTGAGTAEVFIADALRGTTAYSTSIDASAALHLMTNRSKNAWIDGAVGELIVTGDTATRADYHLYLAQKWGLT